MPKQRFLENLTLRSSTSFLGSPISGRSARKRRDLGISKSPVSAEEAGALTKFELDRWQHHHGLLSEAEPRADSARDKSCS